MTSLNMSENSDLDTLISLVTKGVMARLNAKPEQGKQKWASDPTKPCFASPKSCNGCGFCSTRKPLEIDKLINAGAERIGSSPGGIKPSEKLASAIDHTLLKPDATKEELQVICDEAKKWHFATVCVNSCNIPFVAKQLDSSGVKPIAVVGFPLGAATSSAKAFEARTAIREGAREIDMVINIGALRSKDYGTVAADVCKVVDASKPYPVKTILETASLNKEEKIIACALAKAGGAAFVKTSTGFGSGGATIEDIELMRKIVGPEMGVKASGGVRTKQDAENMMKAGANRIGASASVAIVTGRKSNSHY